MMETQNMGPQNMGPQNMGQQKMGQQNTPPLDSEVGRLAFLNDKMLHKLVATFVGNYWINNLSAGIALFIFFIPIGIFANSVLHISWGIIIFFWLFILCERIWSCWIAYPINNTRIPQLSIPTLRQELLQYNRAYWLESLILSIPWLAICIWFAFEVKNALTIHLYIVDYRPRIVTSLFWFIICFGILVCLANILDAYEKNKTINKVVGYIDEFSSGYSFQP